MPHSVYRAATCTRWRACSKPRSRSAVRYYSVLVCADPRTYRRL